MPQIHEVVITHKIEHRVDPVHGHVSERIALLKAGTTVKITFAGDEFEADDTGTFEVTEAAAMFLTSRPNWYNGPQELPWSGYTPAPPRTRRGRAVAKAA